MQRPDAHSFAPRYDWHFCDVEGLETFAISVRPTITNRERERLVAKHQEIVDYELQWVQAGPDRDSEDSPRMREMALIAPYIHDWNATGLLEDGTEAPIPPPAEAGAPSFMAIDTAAYDWIVRHVLLGYRASGKAGGWAGVSRRSPVTQRGTNTEDQN